MINIMAESQPFFDRQRAVSLLEEATGFLREYSDSTPNRNTNTTRSLPPKVNQNLPLNGQSFHMHSLRDSSPTNQNVPQQGQRFQTQSSKDSSENNGRVMENFRSLFASYGRTELHVSIAEYQVLILTAITPHTKES